MNTTIPDLWPADITSSDEPSPAAILRQQGYLLGQKTQNFVVGEVRSSGKPSEFTHEFFVSAPLLNFRERLLTVQHGVRFYPATIRTYPAQDPSRLRAERKASDLASFTNIIKDSLGEEDVRELIQSLANQSRNLDDE